ncbi:MAG: B12-binding domain-containing radical SAM protein [Thermoplasmatales archaeon]|nr:B12-binding domain-containing radical SAM protein [Thermoplasmatales archaeon]
MKILFVRSTEISSLDRMFSHLPVRFPSLIYFYHKALTIPILAALTPKEHTIEIDEGQFKDINFDNPCDLVAISTITRYALNAYEIADEFRKRGIPVVLGGYHPSALPDEAKQHADSVVIGEAEETWPQLLKDFQNGKIKPFYVPTRPVAPSLIPHPRLDILPKGAGVGVHATRGCPYGCDFCSITHMKFRNKFRMKPVDFVIDEIKMIPNKTFFLFDNSVTINKKYSKELFRKMKGLNKKFIGYGNIDLFGKDEEFLKLASEAGATMWMIGLESIYQETLDYVGKKTNIVKEYISTIKKIHDYGMLIFGLFAFGFDTDKLDIFDTTDAFVSKSEIDVPYFHTLSPEPGTPIYKKLDAEGRILTKDWSKYSQADEVVFQPKHMTPEELLYNTYRLRENQYKLSNCFNRIYRARKIGTYVFFESAWSNLYMRHIIHAYAPKQGPAC